MRKSRIRRFISLKRALQALVLGPILLAVTTVLLFSVLLPTNWVSSGRSLPITQFDPTYIAPIAPPITDIRIYSPSTGNGSFLLHGINVGVDMQTFNYNANYGSKPFQTWDTKNDPLPPSVRLSRYRFGWPLRFISFDDISTGNSTINPVVNAYHFEAYRLAGPMRGLDRPAWVPGFIDLYRIPVVTRRGALIANLVVWWFISYILITIVPALIRIRIEIGRAHRGLCIKCKYTLDGLDICPECGTEATTKPKEPEQYRSPVMLQRSEPPNIEYEVNQPDDSQIVLSDDDYFALFCFDGSMEEAAHRVREILELDEPKLRYGLNIGGGEYYSFIYHDRYLYLIDNHNEDVGLPSKIGADFYVWSYLMPKNEITVKRIQHIALKLEAAGLKVELDR